MRQVILTGIGFLLVASLWLSGGTSVQACVNWCEPAECSNYRESFGECTGYYIHTCCDGDEGGAACLPGYYACNNPYGGTTCCEVDVGDDCECGVKADGMCKNCNQLYCKIPGWGVNCPAGTVRTSTLHALGDRGSADNQRGEFGARVWGAVG
jgi:hypothetical protein